MSANVSLDNAAPPLPIGVIEESHDIGRGPAPAAAPMPAPAAPVTGCCCSPVPPLLPPLPPLEPDAAATGACYCT